MFRLHAIQKYFLETLIIKTEAAIVISAIRWQDQNLNVDFAFAINEASLYNECSRRNFLQQAAISRYFYPYTQQLIQ